MNGKNNRSYYCTHTLIPNGNNIVFKLHFFFTKRTREDEKNPKQRQCVTTRFNRRLYMRFTLSLTYNRHSVLYFFFVDRLSFKSYCLYKWCACSFGTSMNDSSILCVYFHFVSHFTAKKVSPNEKRYYYDNNHNWNINIVYTKKDE